MLLNELTQAIDNDQSGATDFDGFHLTGFDKLVEFGSAYSCNLNCDCDFDRDRLRPRALERVAEGIHVFLPCNEAGTVSFDKAGRAFWNSRSPLRKLANMDGIRSVVAAGVPYVCA